MADQEVPESEKLAPQQHAAYADLAQSATFIALRKRFLGFALPATIAFMLWYVIYVLCNNWARGFMDTQVVGHVNVALVFGLLQFASTFLIAILYARHAGRSLDPDAATLKAEFERRTGREEAAS